MQDTTGVRKTYDTQSKFTVSMMNAPCAACPSSGFWFCCQFLPMTMACTQYKLRSKLLKGDMSQYQCFQGQFVVCCCIKAGACGEQSCPELCLCAESCFCNGYALSATRYVVMEKYGLSSDPCDNRLIRISNCLQILSCVCDILAIIDNNFREIARIIGWIADVVYHTVSGCATAQCAHEMNIQDAKPQPQYDPNHPVAYATPYTDPKYNNQQGNYDPKYNNQQGNYN